MNENPTAEAASWLNERLGVMTIDEHIAQAKEWGSKLPYYPGMVGWRTTCRALAEEVERLRREAKAIDAQHTRVIQVWQREEKDWIDENLRYRNALEQIASLPPERVHEATSLAYFRLHPEQEPEG